MKATLRIERNGHWDIDIPIVLSEWNFNELSSALKRASLETTTKSVIENKSSIQLLTR